MQIHTSYQQHHGNNAVHRKPIIKINTVTGVSGELTALSVTHHRLEGVNIQQLSNPTAWQTEFVRNKRL